MYKKISLVLACLLLLSVIPVMAQEDYCEGDFDRDLDQDGTDAAVFKTDFGRNKMIEPCPSSPGTTTTTATSNCPEGTSPCGGSCERLDVDENNCGSCGNPCEGFEKCVNGVCETCDQPPIPTTTTTSICKGLGEDCSISSECCDGCCCYFEYEGFSYQMCMDEFTCVNEAGGGGGVCH